MKPTMQRIALLVVVTVLAACGSPESAWEKATNTNTVKAYEKYASKYPEDPNAEEALTRIDILKKTEIHRAVAAGDKDRVQALLDEGTDVNTIDGARIAPLHVAVVDCQSDLAEYLISAGASAVVAGDDQSTPLHHAARAGCLEALRLLLEHGADVDAEVRLSAVGFVVQGDGVVSFGGQSRTVKGTPLHWASDSGQTAAAVFLIENGAEVDNINGYGLSPLHLAARNGSVSTVELLLEHGSVAQYGDQPDDRYPTKSGQPIHYASSIPIIEALLANGATINAETNNTGLPIHMAASHGYEELVEYYLANGVDPNVLGKWDTGSGWSSDLTPLWTATNRGHLDVVKLLVANGGNLEFSTTGYQSGGTLLHAAAVSRNPDLIGYLLDKGLDINAYGTVSTGQVLVQPFHSVTPLAVAAYHGRIEAVQLLVERGADIKLKVYDNWNVIQMAIKSGNPELVRYMLDHGAEINATVDSIEGWRISEDMKATIKDFLSENESTETKLD